MICRSTCTGVLYLLSGLLAFLPAVVPITTPLTLQHDQCRLDSSLLTLAGKTPSVDSILAAVGVARQCPIQPVPQTPSTAKPDGNVKLIYVTPWNRDGYSYTTLHAERITHVAPVWYRVHLEKSAVTLAGSHDVNETWLSSLQEADVRIVPRFEVTFAGKKDIEGVLFFPRDEVKHIVGTIVDEVEWRGYHGATLEVPYTAQMTSLVRTLGSALHRAGKQLILVIPAHHHSTTTTDRSPHQEQRHSPFSRADMIKVGRDVDHFSLNAYDHGPSLGSDSGNAPIHWLRHILKELLSPADIDDDDDDPFGEDEPTGRDVQHESSCSSKLLLGLNFYGYTITTDGTINSITAQEYLSLLHFSRLSLPLVPSWVEASSDPVRPDSDAEFGSDSDPDPGFDNGVVGELRLDGRIWGIWYPTPLSLLHRLSLAQEFALGGVAVWEAGQGLPHFWDVLLS